MRRQRQGNKRFRYVVKLRNCEKSQTESRKSEGRAHRSENNSRTGYLSTNVELF
jgi:hypothetical protein